MKSWRSFPLIREPTVCATRGGWDFSSFSRSADGYVCASSCLLFQESEKLWSVSPLQQQHRGTVAFVLLQQRGNPSLISAEWKSGPCWGKDKCETMFWHSFSCSDLPRSFKAWVTTMTLHSSNHHSSRQVYKCVQSSATAWNLIILN